MNYTVFLLGRLLFLGLLPLWPLFLGLLRNGLDGSEKISHREGVVRDAEGVQVELAALQGLGEGLELLLKLGRGRKLQNGCLVPVLLREELGEALLNILVPKEGNDGLRLENLGKGGPGGRGAAMDGGGGREEGRSESLLAHAVPTHGVVRVRQGMGHQVRLAPLLLGVHGHGVLPSRRDVAVLRIVLLLLVSRATGVAVLVVLGRRGGGLVAPILLVATAAASLGLGLVLEVLRSRAVQAQVDLLHELLVPALALALVLLEPEVELSISLAKLEEVDP